MNREEKTKPGRQPGAPRSRERGDDIPPDGAERTIRHARTEPQRVGDGRKSRSGGERDVERASGRKGDRARDPGREDAR